MYMYIQLCQLKMFLLVSDVLVCVANVLSNVGGGVIAQGFEGGVTRHSSGV